MNIQTKKEPQRPVADEGKSLLELIRLAPEEELDQLLQESGFNELMKARPQDPRTALNR